MRLTSSSSNCSIFLTGTRLGAVSISLTQAKSDVNGLIFLANGGVPSLNANLVNIYGIFSPATVKDRCVVKKRPIFISVGLGIPSLS